MNYSCFLYSEFFASQIKASRKSHKSYISRKTGNFRIHTTCIVRLGMLVAFTQFCIQLSLVPTTREYLGCKKPPAFLLRFLPRFLTCNFCVTECDEKLVKARLI